jgi:RNA polymerase sigma-B factor
MTLAHKARSSQRANDNAEEVMALFRRYRSDGDRHARDQLVEMHMGLAQMLARQFEGRGESHDDLHQVASLGLLKAIERFDPERGTSLSTFALPTIVGELKRHFRDKGWMVRVPRSVQELRSEISEVTSHLTQELGHSPKATEIADRLGFGVELVLEALAARRAYRCASLEASRSADDVAIADHLGRPDRGFDRVLDRAEVERLLESLPPRERRIVALRFFGCLTQSEIARRLGLSQMHVSRLLNESLGRLRAQLAANDGAYSAAEPCPSAAAS